MNELRKQTESEQSVTQLLNVYRESLKPEYQELLSQNAISNEDITVFTSVKFLNHHYTSILYTKAKKSCNFVSLSGGQMGSVQFYFEYGSLKLLLIHLYEEFCKTDHIIKVCPKDYYICEVSDLTDILLYM